MYDTQNTIEYRVMPFLTHRYRISVILYSLLIGNNIMALVYIMCIDIQYSTVQYNRYLFGDLTYFVNITQEVIVRSTPRH